MTKSKQNVGESSQTATVAQFLDHYGWLLIITIMLVAFEAIYVVYNIPHSNAATFIAVMTMPICIARWIELDARRRGCTPFYDFGMFLMATWLISVPVYLLWTRRWRGFLIIGMFLMLLVTPSICAVALWMALVVLGL